MAALTNTTNYSSDVLNELYRVLTTGFATREKGLLRLIPGVSKEIDLPKIVGGDDPIGAYVAGSPSSETASAVYGEKKLTVYKSMVYLNFVPSDWLEIWPMFRSVGSMTNLALNPEVLSAVLEVLGNKIGNQLDRLVWQGNTALSAPSPLRFIEGFLKLFGADGDVVDVANEGAITKDNVFDILNKIIVDNMTDYQREDPDMVVLMNSGDLLKAQMKNKELRGGYVGYLDTNEGSSYLGKSLIGLPGIPANTIVSTKTGMGANTNLFMGAWVDPDAESNAVRIMPVANDSDTWFLRINFKYGVSHRTGTDVLMYQGS